MKFSRKSKLKIFNGFTGMYFDVFLSKCSQVPMVGLLVICFLWNLIYKPWLSLCVQFSCDAWEAFIDLYESRVIFNNVDLC